MSGVEGGRVSVTVLSQDAPTLRCCPQACVSGGGGVSEAGRPLLALQELCETLNPEEAHRLAHTQLRECQSRLADIQRQFSGDQDVPLPESR